MIRAYVPRKLAPLLKPARYKGAHGGRGGAKSHFFAEQLLLRCYMQPTRAVCIREVQNSIKESVQQLLLDKIAKLGLSDHFDPYRDEIRGKGKARGSQIIFRGMQTYNAENIKSLEGYDVAWVEEAQTFSDHSLRLLRPTIRKPGSELWFSWNPRHDTDAVDKMLRGPSRPRDSIVVDVGWQDNPWLPDVLRQEMEDDYAADAEMAEHVWGGGYLLVSEGAYYARQIVQAEKEGRVGHFPYNPALPVKTSWDLGVHDYTAIWFWQDDGFKATVIDFYEATGGGLEQAIANALPEIFIPPPWNDEWAGWDKSKALERLGRDVPFRYGDHFLPHDIRVREWGGGARTRVELAIRLGMENIRKGVATNPEDRIEAVRALLPVVRFNHTPRVAQGITRLRRYRRKWNDTLKTYTTPEKDGNDHAADAAGEFAINAEIKPADVSAKPDPIRALLKPKTLADIMQDDLDLDD